MASPSGRGAEVGDASVRHPHGGDAAVSGHHSEDRAVGCGGQREHPAQLPACDPARLTGAVGRTDLERVLAEVVGDVRDLAGGADVARQPGTYPRRRRQSSRRARAMGQREDRAVPLEDRQVAALIRLRCHEALRRRDGEGSYGGGELYVDAVRRRIQRRHLVQAAARVVDDPRAIGRGVAHVASFGVVLRVLGEVTARGVDRPELRLLVRVRGERSAQVGGEDEPVAHPCRRVDACGLVGERPRPGPLLRPQPQLWRRAAPVALPHGQVAPVRRGHSDRPVLADSC